MVEWGSKLKKGNGIFFVVWGRVTGAELMPRLVGGNTELDCGKLKSWKGFLKPNSGTGPKLRTGLRRVRRIEWWFLAVMVDTLDELLISHPQAERLDIINQVVPVGQALQAARQYAETICENSPSAVRLTKQLLNETAEHASIDDAMRTVPNVINDLLSSEDFMEGPRAFAEKRKLRWTGKLRMSLNRLKRKANPENNPPPLIR